MKDQSDERRLLGAALTASMGELLILFGEQCSPQPQTYREGLSQLLHLRKAYPALGAVGQRKQIQTSDDTRFYAFLREYPDQMPVLAVFNFQPDVQSVSLNLADRSFHSLEDLLTGEQVNLAGDTVSLDLPAYGYRFLGLKE